jgi:hypothetical protein
MALTHGLLADMCLRGLYESQALWNKMNRSFDGLVADKTMDSIDIPINPQLVASTAAVSKTSPNRKKAKTDSNTVNVPFALYTIGLTQEEEERILMNGKLLNNFLLDTNDALSDALDAVVIAEAQTTDKVITWAGANLTWGDIVNVDAKFNLLKVPKRNRVVIIPASRQADFMSIDVVKSAMAFNKDLLEKGVFVINNTQFYISSYVGQIGSKDNIVGINTGGLAVVLKGYMSRNSVYDTDTRMTYVDYNTGAATKLLKTEFAVVAKQP